jgi:hypothetical protein
MSKQQGSFDEEHKNKKQNTHTINENENTMQYNGTEHYINRKQTRYTVLCECE